MMRKYLCLFVATILSNSYSCADNPTEFDGVSLYSMCFGDMAKSGSDLLCQYYVRGIIEGLAIEDFIQKHGYQTCIPFDTLKPKQVMLILENYMRGSPDKLNQEPSAVVVSALVEAYSCKKEKMK